MSIESLAIALHHTSAGNAASKLVLIGIANHDGDGGSWPTVASLADYAEISTRHVQRILGELERAGEIRRLIQAGGTAEVAHFDRPNLYRFLLTCPPNCDRSSNHKLLCLTCHKPLSRAYRGIGHHPDCAVENGMTSASPGDPQVAREVTPVSPKPSLEPTPRLNEEPRVTTRARARDEERSAPALCRNGHRIIAVTESGIPFCDLGCAYVAETA